MSATPTARNRPTAAGTWRWGAIRPPGRRKALPPVSTAGRQLERQRLAWLRRVQSPHSRHDAGLGRIRGVRLTPGGRHQGGHVAQKLADGRGALLRECQSPISVPLACAHAPPGRFSARSFIARSGLALIFRARRRG